ncbi:MAG: hypothetical protein L3K24_05410 [Gammaproteobacteria bacterium]|nr:hypothetical protein [Gammaproteobacteria bacterium]
MEHWQKLLHPDLLRHNLISSSIYLTAYESCCTNIIDKPKEFFTDIVDSEFVPNEEEYKKDVMSLSKSPLEASLKWFKNMEAVDNEDIEKFNKARKLRNNIAHDLLKYISEPGCEVTPEDFERLLSVTHKIGVWWVINYELPLNPDYNGEKIKESGIQLGLIMMIQMMMDIAFGNEPEEGFYYKSVFEREST